MSDITLFATLVEAFPTWQLLRAHLISTVGLTIAFTNTYYALIHYSKGKSDMSSPVARAFRSVVWDVLRNRPVSVTPAKSEDGESVPLLPSSNQIVQLFHDGTMMARFRCRYTGETIVHTRTYFGGTNTFFGTRTFGEMFEEARANTYFQDPDSAYGTIPLPPVAEGVSETYILRHPANRIVTPVAEPKLVPIYVATFLDDGIVTVNLPPQGMSALYHPCETTELLFQYYDIPRWTSMLGIQQGLVIHDLATSRRYKVRTTQYNAARRLRGNSASLDFQYLTLWKANTLMDYLRIYPEERSATSALIQRWKTISSEVYQFYTDIFKNHTLRMDDVPRKYKPLLFSLHEMYKATLKPHRLSVKWDTCREFMNQRDVEQMLFVLNWDAREATRPRTATAPAAATATAVTAVSPPTYPIILATNRATNRPIATATATATATAEADGIPPDDEDDYSDMPPLISILPPPPSAASPLARVEVRNEARIESGPVY